MSDESIHLSVIVPAYNEVEVLLEFSRRLSAALNNLPLGNKVIYINDGSIDKTREIIDALFQKDDRVALVELSRNFGKEAALTAGLDYATGDAAIVIDADLQDPPELIPELVRV